MSYVSVFDLFLSGTGRRSSLGHALTRAARGFRALVGSYLDGREGRRDGEYRILVYLYGGFGSGLRRDDDIRRISEVLEGIGPLFDADTALHIREDEAGDDYPRGMEFKLMAESEEHGSRLLLSRRWYGISGALVCSESGELLRHEDPSDPEAAFPEAAELPYPFENLAELTGHLDEGLDIAEVAAANETAIHGELRLRKRVSELHDLILADIRRFAEQSARRNGSGDDDAHADALQAPERTSWKGDRDGAMLAYLRRRDALADGGEDRLFAPGAWAGALFQALMFHRWHAGAAEDEQDRRERELKRIILTAGAIGIALGKGRLHQVNRWGCQGELGIASAMAAGGLAAAEGLAPPAILAAANAAFSPMIGLACRSADTLHPCADRSALAAARVLSAVRVIGSSDDAELSSLDLQRDLLEAALRRARRAAADMRSSFSSGDGGGADPSLSQC
jgi:L-serine dehydratase